MIHKIEEAAALTMAVYAGAATAEQCAVMEAIVRLAGVTNVSYILFCSFFFCCTKYLLCLSYIPRKRIPELLVQAQ